MVVSNFTLMIQTAQPSDILVWVAFISAASAIASAVLVGYINYHTTKKLEQQRFRNTDQLENQKIKNIEYQRKQQTYSELKGRQRARMQVYAAYFSAQINANYYDLLSIVNAISRIDYSLDQTLSEINAAYIHERANSIFYKEQQIERERVANYMLLSADASEQFFSTLGLIKVLFLDTQQLRDLIKQIEIYLGKFSLLTLELDNEYNNCVTSILNSKINSNEVRDNYVSKWTSEVNSKKTTDVKRYITIYKEIDSKINELLNYLEIELKKEIPYKLADGKFNTTEDATDHQSIS